MDNTDDTVSVTAQLPRDVFDALVRLAKERGVSANTVLQQAIARENYFTDKEAGGASILIEEKDKTIKKLLRK